MTWRNLLAVVVLFLSLVYFLTRSSQSAKKGPQPMVSENASNNSPKNSKGTIGKRNDINILSSLWQDFDPSSREYPGFGMYTYVFGVDYEDPKMQVLVSEIKRTTASFDKGLVSGENRRFYNLFQIPKDSIANQHLNIIFRLYYFFLQTEGRSPLLPDEKLLASLLVNSVGPFLVSSVEPLGRLSEEKLHRLNLLYVDLSDFNIGGIEELVSAYKIKIEELDGLEGVNVFYEKHLMFLDLALDMNDHIVLTRATIFNWIKPWK